MTEFLIGILAGAPLFVWPLLALLIFIGMRARQSRRAPVMVFYMLPLMGAMALRTASDLPAGAWVWTVFGLAYVLGAAAGYALQRRWTGPRDGARVQLAGESLTLLVVMVLFWANFVGGMLEALSPATYLSSVFQGVFAALLAASSGSFAGRAVQVLRAA